MQDRKRDPRRQRDDTPTDPLLLAAVARAQRHRAPDGAEAAIWDILDHLAIGVRTALARRVRARLELLRDDGLLRRSRRHGIVV